MRGIIVLLFIFILTVSNVTLFFPVKAEARTIIIPDDYPTISSAIGNATDGDTIFVKKGTYIEDSLTVNKTITLMGEDQNATIIHNPWKAPPWNPSLNPFPPQKPIAIQVTANNVKLSGFTITGDIKSISIIANGAQIVGNTVDSIEVHGNNNTITENSIKTYIKCTGTYNSFIANQLIDAGTYSNPYSGFRVSGDSNMLYANNFSGSLIEISGAHSNMIAKNTGTILFFFISSRASNNIVYGNRISGDLSLSGHNNIFYANQINTISIASGSSIYANNNTFYHNNILGHNTFLGETPELWVHTKEPGLLVWDNGKEGNHWKNYLGTDTNGDGIGDIPYMITAAYSYYDGAIREQAIVGCGYDNFPLMVPFDIENVDTSLPNWTTQASTPPQEPNMIETQVKQPTSQKAAPTILVVTATGASAFIVVVGLFVFFKKRRQLVRPKI